MSTSYYRENRCPHGYNGIALAPGVITVHPDRIDPIFTLGMMSFSVHIFAEAIKTEGKV